MSMKHLQLRPRQFLTGIIAVSFVAVFSALMLFVTNDPLQRSQDTRKQAAIPEQGTIAEIKITPAAASIEVGKSSSFVISGLTGGSDTYGFQFVGAIDTANIENISITSHPQANLGFPVATVTGSEIVIFATHPNITPAVNISSFQDLATISFTAKKAGTVTITPNQSNSKVIDKTSSVNILKPMSAANIQIAHRIPQ